MRDWARREGEPAKPPAAVQGPGPASVEKFASPSQPVAYYKSRSLVAQYWGALNASGQPLRQVTAEQAQATFLRGMLDTPLARRERTPFEWIVSCLVHLAVVAACVIVPLAFTGAIDSDNLSATYLTMPRPPEAAPPSAAKLPVKQHSLHRIATPLLTMPTIIPKKIYESRNEDAPDVGAGAPAGGPAGGVLGGVLGGITGGPAPPPPPPPAAARKGIQRVGGDVREPRQIVKVEPEYPTVARTAKVEGVVLVDAVINEQGEVTRARAISGPGLLIPAALRAVMQWKYEPTYLDGMPVSIEIKVEVGFRLHD